VLICQIIQIRAEAEGVRLSPDALGRLCEIGKRASLRYTMQLLTPAKLLNHIGGRETVEVFSTIQFNLIQKNRLAMWMSAWIYSLTAKHRQIY
jgi:DNA helicase TIP49 (TBP-interacting protein)